MPELTTVSVQEAKLRTMSGRQGKFMKEFIDYIQQVPSGQAGKLHVVEQENPLTIRRRLVTAAKAMNIPLTIKRSGNELYFWREDGEEDQPRPKRRYTRRRGLQEETTTQDQPITEPEEFEVDPISWTGGRLN
jgi:hypothetical protein